MSATPMQFASQGHSADVRMHLAVNGRVLRIGQLGPDFLILEETINHPATEAEVILSIDDRVARWRVFLTNGITAGQPRAFISNSPAA